MTPAPIRATFQTKFFFAALSAAMLALAVAGTFFTTTMRQQIDATIERTLVAETRMAADLVEGGTTRASALELHNEARRIGSLIGARVTFIAPDGRVVGDSAETFDGLAAMENHAQRPEVVEARDRPEFIVAEAEARRREIAAAVLLGDAGDQPHALADPGREDPRDRRGA